jgi:hypothetical protein
MRPSNHQLWYEEWYQGMLPLCEANVLYYQEYILAGFHLGGCTSKLIIQLSPLIIGHCAKYCNIITEFCQLQI